MKPLEMLYQPRNCLPINATGQCRRMLLLSTMRSEQYTDFMAGLIQNSYIIKPG